MALETTTNSIRHFGNGVTTSFPYDFRVDLEGDMQVFKFENLVDPLEYTILGLGEDNGGSVEFEIPSTPEADELVTIIRIVPATQQTVYPDYGPFPAKSHELALDKLTMLTQQLFGFGEVGIRVPAIDPPAINKVLPAPADRALKFIYFDEFGNVEVNDGLDLDIEAVLAVGIALDSVTMLYVDSSDENFPLVGVFNQNLPAGLMRITQVDEYLGLPAGGIPPQIVDNTPAIAEAIQNISIAGDSTDMLILDFSTPSDPILGVNNINGEAGLMQLVSQGDYPEFPGLPGGGIPIEVLSNTPFLLFAVPVDDGTAQPGTDSQEMLTTYRQTNPADPFGFVDILAVNTPNQAEHLVQLDEFGQIPSELLRQVGLRNRGIFRGDDLCDKPGDEALACTVPDTRNPSERFPALDYPPGTDPETIDSNQFRAGDFFSITMEPGELSGTMNLFTDVGDVAPSIVTVEANDGIVFIPQVTDPDPPNDVLTQHGWYHQPGRFNLTTADLVSVNTAGWGFITPLPNDDVQQAFNFLDAALAVFRADQSSFDTGGGTIIIAPASEDVQLALQDLDQGALSKAAGGVIAALTGVIYGSDPFMYAQNTSPGAGSSSFRVKDSTGMDRGILAFEEATGAVILRRLSDVGVVESTLTLQANGNVTISAAAPIAGEDLTRTDYVQAADAVVRAVADQALADAANALAVANQALADAANALAVANQALADAATAQGTAETAQSAAEAANTNANSRKLEFDFIRSGDRLDINNVRTS